MKKKILIVNGNLNIGGIQKSLVNLIGEIKDKYDITLFLFNKHGELLENISGVEILGGNCFLKTTSMTYDESKKGGEMVFALRNFFALYTKIFSSQLPLKFVSRTMKLKEKYDAAISFSHNLGKKIYYGGCNEFVLNSVNADKKIAFLHGDYKNSVAATAYNLKVLKKFDAIAACSEGTYNSLIEVDKSFAKKAAVVHNCQNYFMTAEQAEEYEPEFKNEYINIVSAARLTYEKGIFRFVKILAQLKNEGYNFYYHILGEGSERKEIEKFICENGLSDNIKLYGQTENPYPFIRKADLLAVPSYYEAAPMVFGEAQFLKTPVFTTETVSAKELVGNLGFVAKNDDESIKNQMRTIFDNMSVLEQRKKMLSETEFSNKNAVEEFAKILQNEKLKE